MKKFLRILLVTILMIFGGLFFFEPSSSHALPEHFVKKTVASGFYQPTDFIETPDKRIFVAEKNGTVKVIQNGTVLEKPLVCGSRSDGCPVDLDVDVFQERGLLGIALDPNFAENHYFYLLYTHANPLEYHLSRFTESNNEAVAGSEVILLKMSANQNAGTHLGGGLMFGPDGKIWFTIGDNTLDAAHEPQKLTSPYGKLHRINPDGTTPADNPFAGQQGAVESIWAYGLRNPFRFSFMPDGRPIIGDVGGSTHEEVNIAEKGKNYGWPLCEGYCDNPEFSNPAFAYPHTEGNSGSISGGIVYTGDMFPEEYKNKYIYGDYVRGYIHMLDVNGSALNNDTSFDAEAGAVITFRQGSDGSLYFLNIFPEGELFQVIYTTENQKPTAKISADTQAGDIPLEVTFSSEGSFDPEKDILNYKWDFGDGTTSTEQNPTHTYTSKGKFTAKLVVNDGQSDSDPVSTVITVGELAPEVKILTPTEGAKYNAGQVLSFSGEATDREDGELPASSFSWLIVFHHNTHTHPFKGPITNVKSGQTTIPDFGESAPDVWYRVYLTVTDSSGLKTTVFRDIHPNLATVTITSSPLQNMVVNVEGIPYGTPKVYQTVVGYNLAVEAQTPLNRGGKTYDFENWSNGQDRIHKFKVPEGETTLTAHYKESGETGTEIVKKNTIIVGDVSINGRSFYDDDPKTGLVILMEEDGEMTAPWGATLIPFPDKESAEIELPKIVEKLKTEGCEGGCTTVTSFKWPSGTPEEKIVVLTSGEKKTFGANTVIIGDIKVNGESMFDDNGESGLITLLEKEGEVEAQWGALAIRHNSFAEADKTVQIQAAELKDTGCGSRCWAVTTAYWPSQKPVNKIEELKPGEKKLLPRFSVVSGDVKINGKDVFDSDEKTGLVIKMLEEGEVEAPWGATYNLNTDEQSANIAAQLLEQKVKDWGCINGCEKVSVLDFPKQIIQQAKLYIQSLFT